MDVGRILTRSLEVSWKYKFLWLYAFILALTAGQGLGQRPNFGNPVGAFGNSPLARPFQLEPAVVVLAVMAGFILFLVWAVLTFYFRFVARGAMVSAVNTIETGGTTNLRQSWTSGRTFYTRLLGLGLLVNIPFILFAIAAVVVVIVPLVGLAIAARGQANTTAGGIIAALGIGGFFAICCVVVCIVVLTLVIHPLYEFAVRAIVIENLHVREGIRAGIAQVREHLGNVLLVYGVLIGARLIWGVLVGVVTLPVMFILTFGILNLLSTNLSLLVIIVLLLAVPLWIFLSAIEGIFQLFEANMWTETYLALKNKVGPV